MYKVKKSLFGRIAIYTCLFILLLTLVAYGADCTKDRAQDKDHQLFHDQTRLQNKDCLNLTVEGDRLRDQDKDHHQYLDQDKDRTRARDCIYLTAKGTQDFIRDQRRLKDGSCQA